MSNFWLGDNKFIEGDYSACRITISYDKGYVTDCTVTSYDNTSYTVTAEILQDNSIGYITINTTEI